jgi:hypothetical protein
LGFFNGLDPENTQLLRNDGYADPVDFMKSTGYKALWLLMGLGFVVALIWILQIWRTYRESSMGVSPGRSAIAFVIFALLSPVAIALQFSMAVAVSPQAYRRDPSVRAADDRAAQSAGVH